MNILLLSSEVAPFAKTGGLADVAGSLPKALRRLGCDVRVGLPAYRTVRERFRLEATGVEVAVPVAGRPERAAILTTSLDGVPVYLVDHPGYFVRDGLYGTPAGDYPDNAERFGFFCRAALAMLEPLGFRPEVLHCNDWQTGLVPVLLHTELKDDPFFAGCGTLFTIHNLGYQGLFPPTALSTLGLDPGLFTIHGVEYWGHLSFLKGGIVFADRVSTVSPTYCRETLGPEQGLGFDGILRGRGSDYSGILNGLDPKQWNPAFDHALPHRYDESDLRGKAVCKRALQKELGLAAAPGTPVVALVTRLDTQKGLELVEQAWEELLGREMQLVLLGTGEERHTAFFAAVQDAHPGQVAIRLEFDEALSRRIYAGADLFLMPSRYEPCGLGQLIALRYGTVPVVRKTGGLADTVTDPQDDAAAANGFSFEESAPEALLAALDRALALYHHRTRWLELVRRGMTQDFSWGRSAQRYLGLYHRIAEARHAHP